MEIWERGNYTRLIKKATLKIRSRIRIFRRAVCLSLEVWWEPPPLFSSASPVQRGVCPLYKSKCCCQHSLALGGPTLMFNCLNTWDKPTFFAAKESVFWFHGVYAENSLTNTNCRTGVLACSGWSLLAREITWSGLGFAKCWSASWGSGAFEGLDVVEGMDGLAGRARRALMRWHATYLTVPRSIMKSGSKYSFGTKSWHREQK